MGTTAQRLYPTSTDQDQSWGTDVRKNSPTAGAANSSTVAAHPNSSGTTTITLRPYVSNSTQGDDTTNYGWAVNEASADGMQSTSTAKRRIPPGTWRFLITAQIPAGGAVTGSHNVTVTWKVYRVATGGGTRTLLFSHASGEQSGGLLGATRTYDETTASQPEIILEPGETIHVGITSTDRQQAGALGATTSGTITYTTGGDGDAFVEVASPGIRTQYIRSHGVTGTGTAGLQRRISRVLPAAVTGTAGFVRRITAARRFTVTATGSAGFARRVTAVRGFANTVTGSAAIQRQIRRLLPVTVTGTATRGPFLIRTFKVVTATGTVVMARLLGKTAQVTATGTPTFARRLTAVRQYSNTVTGSPRLRLDIPEAALDRIQVGGPTDTGAGSGKTISGVVRDVNGNPYAGATVQLVRESDGFVAQTTTSAGDGSYSFNRSSSDPNTYRVIAWEDEGTPTQGISARGLVPV